MAWQYEQLVFGSPVTTPDRVVHTTAYAPLPNNRVVMVKKEIHPDQDANPEGRDVDATHFYVTAYKYCPDTEQMVPCGSSDGQVRTHWCKFPPEVTRVIQALENRPVSPTIPAAKLEALSLV